MLSDFTALEVAIGLSFVYMVLAFLCSGINEAVSSVFGWRAVMLEEGIRNLLADPDGKGLAARVYGHPLIQALTRPSKAGQIDTQGIRRARPVRRFVAWTRRER